MAIGRWTAPGLCGLLLAMLPSVAAGVPARFDDSPADVFRLSDSGYEIAFRKTDGAITSIRIPSASLPISAGSNKGCLWGAYGASAGYVGGCGYSPAGTERFSYAWDPASATLTMTYDGSRARTIVAVQAMEPNAVDFSLTIENRQNGRLDWVLFPSELLFEESSLREVLFPILPGVAVQKSFFDQNRTFTTFYPGNNGAFADFLAISSEGGELAVYAVGSKPHPLNSGLAHVDSATEDRSIYVRAFGAAVAKGATWQTPRVRFRFGETWLSSVNAFRTDNGLDSFASLRTKLGSRYDAIVRAPVLKLDMEKMKLPFRDFGVLLEQLPVPSILHPAAYGPRWHDEDYPDYMPPHPSLGTTEEYAAMVRDAHARGMLVMPYTNPTAWDEESPTMRSLPSGMTFRDVSVIDLDGKPVYEVYFGKGTFTVSPWVPFVIQRVEQSHRQMSDELRNDIIFEDQIGARPWMFDLNPASPTPMSYIDGWIEHTRRHRDKLLTTEMGFDFLGETEIGFFGATPRVPDDAYNADRFGAGNWKSWPFAPLLLRDKVLFYVHNLEERSSDKATLRFCMAMGYMLHYAVHNPFVPVTRRGPGGGLDTDGFKIVAQLQPRVVARYAGERILAYETLAPGVTKSTFQTHSVIANWNDTEPRAAGPHLIAPGGWMVTSDDGTLTAGVFRSWNGVPLRDVPGYGDHFIIEERGPSEIRFAKPAEVDSDVTIVLPPGWKATDPLEVRLHALDGSILGTAAFTRSADRIAFHYERVRNDTLVSHYTIRNTARGSSKRRAAG